MATDSRYVITGFSILAGERTVVSDRMTKAKAEERLQEYRKALRKYGQHPYRRLRIEPAEREGELFAPSKGDSILKAAE